MEKIILSRRVWMALEEILKISEKSSILETHSMTNDEWAGKYEPLNELSLEQMAIALYLGYEVEETTEEKLLKYFSSLVDTYNRTNEEVYLEKMATTKQVLNFLGIKIEGVNC